MESSKTPEFPSLAMGSSPVGVRTPICRTRGMWNLSTDQEWKTPETEQECLEYYQEKIAHGQNRQLLPLQEDLADWLNTTLKQRLSAGQNLTCSACGNQFCGTVNRIKCSRNCGKIFHVDCSGLNKAAAKFVTEDKNIFWFCEQCNDDKLDVSGLKSVMERIFRILIDQNAEIKLLREQLSALQASMRVQ